MRPSPSTTAAPHYAVLCIHMHAKRERELEMTTIVYRNLTSHALNIKTLDGTAVIIPPDPAGVARVVYDRFPPEQATLNGQEVQISVAGSPREIVGLPEPEPNTVLIVAKAVTDAAPRSRGDLMSPGRLIRDEDGNVVGCDGLTRRA